jgi:hypothetical protein
MTPTFTPAQQTFHDALTRVDGKLLLIARQVIEAGLTPRADGKTDPEEFGAPVGTSEWAKVEAAADVFDRTAGGDDKTLTRAALDVVNAVLAAKGIR